VSREHKREDEGRDKGQRCARHTVRDTEGGAHIISISWRIYALRATCRGAREARAVRECRALYYMGACAQNRSCSGTSRASSLPSSASLDGRGAPPPRGCSFAPAGSAWHICSTTHTCVSREHKREDEGRGKAQRCARHECKRRSGRRAASSTFVRHHAYDASCAREAAVRGCRAYMPMSWSSDEPTATPAAAAVEDLSAVWQVEVSGKVQLGPKALRVGWKRLLRLMPAAWPMATSSNSAASSGGGAQRLERNTRAPRARGMLDMIEPPIRRLKTLERQTRLLR
jgi:hypothetical protein